MEIYKIRAVVFVVILAIVVAYSGLQFRKLREEEPIVRGPGVTEVRMLSDYFPDLKGTNGDTEIYVLQGSEPGGSILVLGGTHPNEPSGYMSAIAFIENATVQEGTLYIIPRANNSAFTHSDPQEAAPQRFVIETANGERWFRYGSRATNPLDQWPDPDVYIHASSGQKLSGSETRNLNRGYPGKADGTFTEKVCYGITRFIVEESIDMTVDLHEASPEYPVINAIVAHQDAMDIAAILSISMQMEDINIGLEVSPANLHGLTHRELGDFTNTFAVLMETSNAAQGRLRGATNAELALSGIDKWYEKAAKMGRLYVPYDENGHPLEERVGRHVTGVMELSAAMAQIYPDKTVIIENMPTYEELMNNGMGRYLLPVE